jgi:hypothetical protein
MKALPDPIPVDRATAKRIAEYLARVVPRGHVEADELHTIIMALRR